MSEKKKFVEELPAEIPLDAPLSQLLQVVTHDKYRVISLATRWAQEIKQRDQATALPPPPKPEKKDLDIGLPTIILKDNGDAPKGEEPASGDQ